MHVASLAEQAYDIIEHQIVTLVLQPGEFITQKQISESINIGHISVREAFIKLELAHMIKIMPRKGVVVAPIIWTEAFQQIEIRKAIEPILMRDASFNSNAEEREHFLVLKQQFQQAINEKDLTKLISVDKEFNDYVLETSRNPLLEYCILPLWALARRMYYANYIMDDELSLKIDTAHCSLMQAIYEQNTEKIRYHDLEIINGIELLYKKAHALLSHTLYK